MKQGKIRDRIKQKPDHCVYDWRHGPWFDDEGENCSYDDIVFEKTIDDRIERDEPLFDGAGNKLLDSVNVV